MSYVVPPTSVSIVLGRYLRSLREAGRLSMWYKDFSKAAGGGLDYEVDQGQLFIREKGILIAKINVVRTPKALDTGLLFERWNGENWVFVRVEPMQEYLEMCSLCWIHETKNFRYTWIEGVVI
jgi:hypothetical protein